MQTSLLVLTLSACACAITRDQFYPYGPHLDQRLPRGSDVASPELPLKVSIIFYGEIYDSVLVNNHGLISFGAEIPTFMNSEFPLSYPSIAAFYTNVDTTERGYIYYRESTEPHDLLKAEESVQNNFHEFYYFKPTSVFIATWIEVTYPERPDRQNSFQLAVISNGNETFVELLYPEKEIQWIQRETHASSFPNAKAQAGFVAEDGRVFVLRGSGSSQIRNIVSWSNTHEPGKYVYRVGNIPMDGNVVDPDQFDQNEFEIEEESKTCAQSGPSVCHIQAQCVDYQAGICCQCNEGFYGNGKKCIKDNLPLRVHGKLDGIINDVNLNNVLIQAYVVVADGRAYTALSQSPPTLGSSLQLLNVLGGVIGWLFAKPTSTAQNGYQLTGALFNHTADIFFPRTGDRVTINQKYLGQDVFDQITLDANIRGTIPVILSGTQLEVTEYEEQYNLIEPGLIRSESTRTFTNKLSGERYEQRVSQTFKFNPCRFAPSTDEDSTPLTLKVAKNYLDYEVKENIVRYAMRNKINPLGQEDPCIQGRNYCGEHSVCVVQGDSFRCVCQSGYTQIQVDATDSCVDIDECAARVHNCDTNADCYNHEGGFQCRCRAGFEGNGISCRAVSQCRDKICDPNAQCVEHYAVATCVCNPHYQGDGNTCWPEQDQSIQKHPCEQCSPYASCSFDQENNRVRCECNEGYTGDGYYCVQDYYSSEPTSTSTPLPPTTTSYEPPYTYEEEYNETFVLPDCQSYPCICPSGYSSYRDERNNDLCRLDQYTPIDPYYPTRPDNSSINCVSDSECPPNAICQFSPTDEFGQCECPEGYDGDAYECIERTGPTCSCGPNAHCIETVTGELCVCNSGYRGDGYTCQPSSTCIRDDDCKSNAECRQDANGNNICQCIEGYIRDSNDVCIPELCNERVCAEHASCLFDEDIGVNYCNCDVGYLGDGISQCVLQGNTCDVTNDCHPNAECSLVGNTYICVCNEGFRGDGYTCIPSFSCISDEECKSDAVCRQDASGNYICQCIEGYVKDSNDACIPDVPLCNERICAEHASCLFDEDISVNYCHCDGGYQGDGITQCVLQGNTCDGYQCNLEPNCRNTPYLCDVHASCLKQNGGYTCNCNTGYNGNGSYCVLNPRQAGNFLIVTDGSSVNRVPLRSGPHAFSTPINSVPYQIAVGVDADCETGRIYWGDVADFAIRKTAYDGSDFETFLNVDVKAPEGLSVDWSARNIFWTDSKKLTIEVANLDTKIRKVLFANEDIYNPRGIAVHPQRGKIFWSDWNRRAPKIEWANMDGTQRGIFVDQSDVILPNSLAIDWQRDRLCYTDAGLFAIKCVDIETQEREVIAEGLPYPFGLAVKEGKFYWTDWKTKAQGIQFLDTRTQERGQISITTTSLKLYSLTVAPEQCPPGSNVCQYRNGNCEPGSLCLPDGRGGRTCAPADTN